MPLFTQAAFRFAEKVDALIYANPFSESRALLEAEALGISGGAASDAWRDGPGHRNENLAPLLKKVERTLAQCHPRLSQANEKELVLHGSLIRFKLYYDYDPALHELSRKARAGKLSCEAANAFKGFQQSYLELLPCDASKAERENVAHLWAFAFQLRRAFEEISEGIVGASAPAARLREQIWQSVFTHDMRRYERSLYGRMHQINTLISGPSGTGKEVVARAIGESRYIPFDAGSGRFVEESHGSFLPVNLSSLSPSLVESELFGHKKGSFTGAMSDRVGLLESCQGHGTLFMDEVGELSESLQVKLLRTLQVRELRRIGEEKLRAFSGKLVTATNRDLSLAVSEGNFREDFYFRIVADHVKTPDLRSQLDDCPEDLSRLAATLCRRIVPEEEAASLTREVTTYCEAELSEYLWPGNVRELEQCIRSLLVRGCYLPELRHKSAAPGGAIGERFRAAESSLDEMSDLYVTLAHARWGSLSETARRLGVDRRTIKARLRPELLSWTQS